MHLNNVCWESSCRYDNKNCLEATAPRVPYDIQGPAGTWSHLAATHTHLTHRAPTHPSMLAHPVHN